jgi:hypothetical protein
MSEQTREATEPTPDDGGVVERFRAAIRRLEAGVRVGSATVRLDRRTSPAPGDWVLVLRSGAPSVEPYAVTDQDEPGVWVVGAMRTDGGGDPVAAAIAANLREAHARARPKKSWPAFARQAADVIEAEADTMGLNRARGAAVSALLRSAVDRPADGGRRPDGADR